MKSGWSRRNLFQTRCCHGQMRCRRKPRRNLRWAGPSVLLLSSILQAKHTGRRRGKLFTKSNEEALQNRSDTTKAAMPSAANRQGNEKISRPAIRKAADPLRLRCICITAPFLARNPRQLPLGHRPRWYRAAVASASSQAPADDRSGAARFL